MSMGSFLLIELIPGVDFILNVIHFPLQFVHLSPQIIQLRLSHGYLVIPHEGRLLLPGEGLGEGLGPAVLTVVTPESSLILVHAGQILFFRAVITVVVIETRIVIIKFTHATEISDLIQVLPFTRTCFAPLKWFGSNLLETEKRQCAGAQ